MIFLVFQLITKDFLISIYNSSPLLISLNSLLHYTSISLDIGRFRELIQVLLSVVGIFLGLYFSAITTIISTSYNKVDQSLRDIIWKDKTNSVYLTVIIVAIAQSIFSLIILASNISLSVGNILFTLVIGTISIFSFIILGKGIFNFLNITNLSHYIFTDLIDSFKNVSYKGYNWKDRNFQNHQQKKAQIYIEKLDTLATLIKGNNTAIKQVLPFTKSLINFLSVYMKLYKPFIPRDSFWFKKVAIQQKWFLSDAIKMSISLDTGITLMPEQKPDYEWLERNVISIINNIYKGQLEHLTVHESGDLILLFSVIFEIYGSYLEFDYPNTIYKDLKRDYAYTFQNSKDLFDRIAIADSLAYLNMELALGLIKSLDIKNFEELKIETVKKIKHKDDVLKVDLAYPIQQSIEEVAKQVKFERSANIEATPNKHLEDLFQNIYAIETIKQLEKFYSTTLGEIINYALELRTNSFYTGSTVVALRAWELYKKIINIYEFLDGKSEQLKSDKYYEPIVKEYEAFKERMKSARDQIIDILNSNLSFLNAVSDEKIPDYYGQSYNILYFELERSLRLNDAKTFEKIFPVVFRSAIKIFGDLVIDLNKRRTTVSVTKQNLISTQPLIDLIEISGYAKLYSELYGNTQLWEICVKVWDGDRKRINNETKFIDLWRSIYIMRDQAFGVFERDILRQNWQGYFNSKLIELGVKEKDAHYGYYGSPVPKHKSKIIRKWANSDFALNDTKDLFVISYFTNEIDKFNSRSLESLIEYLKNDEEED